MQSLNQKALEPAEESLGGTCLKAQQRQRRGTREEPEEPDRTKVTVPENPLARCL